MSYPWHEPLLARLYALRDADQLPNAIAIDYPAGWGGEKLLAEAALGLLGLDTEIAVEEFAHPDFRWIVADGAEIKIDQVRRVNEFAVGTAQAAGRKIAALHEAHLLNPSAANALLKTLEEPPRDTHLLLGTSNWGRLLPTIRSRCQRFVLTPDIDAARAWLADEGLAVSDTVFAECGYAPLTAAAVLADGDATDLTGWLASLTKADVAKSVKLAAEQDTVVWLARWYRRLLIHLGGEPIPGLKAQPATLLEFASKLLSARRQIETSNAANVQLLMEELVVNWRRLARG